MNNDDIKLLNEKHKYDFKRAIDIYENEYSHDDLISLLQAGSVVEKQAAALKLYGLNSEAEAKIFINNLTGCDGKIREAVSFRLIEFIKKNPEYFFNYDEIFIDAIIDINGNICRNTISALKYINNSDFCFRFCKQILEKAYPLAQKALDFDIQEGKYKINKDIFKLYWYLETIYNFVDYTDKIQLAKILDITKNIADYTIREKTAKIISILNNEEFHEIKEKLKQDENYYVRRF